MYLLYYINSTENVEESFISLFCLIGLFQRPLKPYLICTYVNFMSADISDAILLISHIAIILKGRAAASLHYTVTSQVIVIHLFYLKSALFSESMMFFSCNDHNNVE
jgi:hypothetical protein